MRLLTPLVLIVVVIALLLYYTMQRGQEDDAGFLREAASRNNAHLAMAAPDEAKSPNVNPKLGKAVLRGRAIDTLGRPVAGARVVCERRSVDLGDPFAPVPGGSRWVAQTDVQGGFECTALPVGGFALLLSTERLTGSGTASTGDSGGVAEVLVTLQPVARFEGKVKWRDGRDAEGAQVAPVASGDDASTAFRYFPARVNSLGEFAFTYLPQAPTSFLVKRSGAALALVEGVQPGVRNLVIELSEGATLRGEVREADTNQLLPQVKVAVREQALGMEAATVTTNANGEFSVANLRPATYEIDIVPDRYVLSGQRVLAALGGDSATELVTMHAERAGMLRGRVVDLSRQKGCAAVAVVAHLGDRAFPITTDSSGYYQFRALPAGDYRVGIDNTSNLAPGQAPTVTVVPGQMANGPELIAPALASIRGRVLDDADHAAQAANVYLSLDSSETPHLSTATDADGFFIFAEVDQEAMVRVWASRMGRTSVAYGPVRVGSAGITDLNFVLNMTTTAAIRGQVRNAGGAAVPATEVYCLSGDTSLKQPLRTRTATDGRFAFLGLRPGNYRLAAGKAVADLNGPTSYRVDLADGEIRNDVELSVP